MQIKWLCTDTLGLAVGILHLKNYNPSAKTLLEKLPWKTLQSFESL